MKHHISVTVRVDGAIEHIFNLVLEGEGKTIGLIDAAARVISRVDGGWKHERGAGCHNRAKYPWEGASRSIIRWWDEQRTVQG